jgi:hypothetical protein
MPDDIAAQTAAIMAAVLPAEPQRPLYRPLPPPEAFPMQALGPLRDAAEALHDMTQAPEAMCAQSVLAAATLACQAHADVALPSGIRPLTSYFVTIAESGERKSSVDRLALHPVTDKEEALRSASDGERADYAAERTAWEAVRDEAKKKAKSGGKAAVANALRDLGPEPRPPASPMLLVGDPTPEGLTLHLADGRPWAGVFTSEGGMLIGGHAFSDESKMRTGALFNALWDGEPIRRRRAGTGSTFLTGRRCAMHIMVQPVAADRLLSDAMLDGLGLLARMLISAPPSTAGTRMWRETTDGARLAYGDYCRRVRFLLDLSPPMEGDALAPVPLQLHADARAMWRRFHDHAEGQLGDGGAYRGIRGFGAKLAEHAGRLAAVLAFYESGGSGQLVEVQAEHMACGTALAEHYAGEMLRLTGGAEVASELRKAQSVLDWLKGRPGRLRFHVAEIYQSGPSTVRSAASARAAMEILVDHGHAVALASGVTIDGTPRREAWQLVT